MYKIIGCAVVWGFALFGIKEWYERTYQSDNKQSAS